MSTAVTFVQYGAMALNFFGDKIFASMNMPNPSWYNWMKENKMSAMIGIFFGGNIING